MGAESLPEECCAQGGSRRGHADPQHGRVVRWVMERGITWEESRCSLGAALLVILWLQGGVWGRADKMGSTVWPRAG